MSRFSRVCSSIGLVAVAAAGAVLLWSCGEPPKMKTADFRPECPITAITYRDSGGDSLIARTSLALSGKNSLVPEYNDCQRMIVSGASAYGALVGVFARDSLDRWVQRVDTLARKGVRTNAVAIAQLLDFDNSLGYADLGIEPGFNCLYMYGVMVGTAVERHAFMVPVKDAEQLCLTEMMPPADRIDKLLVIPVSLRDYAVGDYVPAARWDWDPSRQSQYIAIGCHDSWCDIVPRGAHTPSPSRDANGLSMHARRGMRIKPWYDEELLAVKGTGPYGLVPATTTGTLIADPALGDLTEADFVQWRRVAGAALSETNPVYKQKLNFDMSTNMNRLNEIEMCKGSRIRCLIPTGTVIPPCPNSADEWWARITSVNGDVAYRCVERRTHTDPNTGKPLIIPGIVRWRWTIDDQGSVWVECPDGCCEIHGKP